jgi:transposase-like protein
MARGMDRPELVVVDGGKGLEAALASLWDDVPVQRCTVHVRYPPEQWRSLRTTDEIDKRFVAAGAMILAHGRPRGEERGGGWEPRRAA